MVRLVFLFFCLTAITGLHAQEIEQLVLFDYNKSDIPDSSLSQVIRTIYRHKVERVLIEGHCDSVGSQAYNKTLSESRAKALYKLLTQNGIDNKNIKTCIGYGKEKPLNSNANDRDRQLNRRVKLTFYMQEAKSLITEDLPLTKKVISNILLEDIKEGSNLVFENLLFEPGRHVLKSESFPVLNEVLNLLQKYPNMKIEIQGHVCCTTEEEDGYDWETDLHNLSEARAEAIYLFLIGKHIQPTRLTHIGFGGSRKINPIEDSEEMRKQNRRVEFKIMKM